MMVVIEIADKASLGPASVACCRNDAWILLRQTTVPGVLDFERWVEQPIVFQTKKKRAWNLDSSTTRPSQHWHKAQEAIYETQGRSCSSLRWPHDYSTIPATIVLFECWITTCNVNVFPYQWFGVLTRTFAILLRWGWKLIILKVNEAFYYIYCIIHVVKNMSIGNIKIYRHDGNKTSRNLLPILLVTCNLVKWVTYGTRVRTVASTVVMRRVVGCVDSLGLGHITSKGTSTRRLQARHIHTPRGAVLLQQFKSDRSEREKMLLNCDMCGDCDRDTYYCRKCITYRGSIPCCKWCAEDYDRSMKEDRMDWNEDPKDWKWDPYGGKTLIYSPRWY